MAVRLKKRTFNGYNEILRISGKALSLFAFVYLLHQLRVLRGLRRRAGQQRRLIVLLDGEVDEREAHEVHHALLPDNVQ